jgi:hypothetical protein
MTGRGIKFFTILLTILFHNHLNNEGIKMGHKHFGGGENAPSFTKEEQKLKAMKAAQQEICVVKPNPDGTTARVEVQMGAIGQAKAVAVGDLPIQTPTKDKKGDFSAGEWFVEGKLSDPKTGKPAGEIAAVGGGMEASYSCLFKGAATGQKIRDGDVLNQPFLVPVTPPAPIR